MPDRPTWYEVRALSPLGFMALALAVTLFSNLCVLALTLTDARLREQLNPLALLVAFPLVTAIGFGLFAATYNLLVRYTGGVRVMLQARGAADEAETKSAVFPADAGGPASAAGAGSDAES